MIKGKASFWGLLHFIICRHIPSRNQLADRIAHGREFLLIFCHYISFVHGVVMEVKGVRLDLPSGLRDGFQRLVKQSPVVGFKLNYSVFCQNLVIYSHKIRRGKPASGVAVLGPGIGEV